MKSYLNESPKWSFICGFELDVCIAHDIDISSRQDALPLINNRLAESTTRRVKDICLTLSGEGNPASILRIRSRILRHIRCWHITYFLPEGSILYTTRNWADYITVTRGKNFARKTERNYFTKEMDDDGWWWMMRDDDAWWWMIMGWWMMVDDDAWRRHKLEVHVIACKLRGSCHLYIILQFKNIIVTCVFRKSIFEN